MTFREFNKNIDEWQQLLDFCYNENLSACDDVSSYDEIMDQIDDHIRDYLSYHSWCDLRDMLNDIDLYDGHYYRVDSWLDYVELDYEDFDEYKRAVMEEMDGYWDDEDEDLEEEEVPYVCNNSIDIHDPDDFEIEDISVLEEQFSLVENELLTIEQSEKLRREAEFRYLIPVGIS